MDSIKRSLFSILIFIAIYEILVNYFNASFLPHFFEILDSSLLLVGSGIFVKHAVPTIGRVTIALIISMVISTIIGGIIGTKKNLRSYFTVPIAVGLTIPGFTWAIISLIWFGIGNTAAIVATVLTVSPFLIVSFSEGLKNIEWSYQDMAKVYKIDKIDQLRHIILPQIASEVIAMLRNGFSLSWKLVIVTELFGLGNGIGNQINFAYHNYQSGLIFSWILCFGIIILFIDGLVFQTIGKRSSRWKEEVKQ